ncbi:MAG: serine hydrolase [Chthoniobacterales bacterium]
MKKSRNLVIGSFCMLVVASSVLHAADSSITVDNQTGYILAKENANDKRQIGSLTKIATAMVVLDWLELSKSDPSATVTVPSEALAVGGVNPAGLMAGDEISVRDLLYSALVASDNVAAQTLAYHVGSKLPNRKKLTPVENFVVQMNSLARYVGMKHTLFLNPSGMDNFEGTLPYSTAIDVAKLTRFAYTKASFKFYVSQKTREIHLRRGGSEMGIAIQSTNALLGEENIDGVKTGRTSHAGDCIVLSSQKAPESRKEGEQVVITPRRIITVILASPDRNAEGLQKIRTGWLLYDQWAAKGRHVNRSEAL